MTIHSRTILMWTAGFWRVLVQSHMAKGHFPLFGGSLNGIAMFTWLGPKLGSLINIGGSIFKSTDQSVDLGQLPWTKNGHPWNNMPTIVNPNPESSCKLFWNFGGPYPAETEYSSLIVSRCKFDLVGGLEHFLFSHILGIIIPID